MTMPNTAGFSAVADRITSPLGAYQTAVVRIGISGTWLALLIREWPNRHRLYGPDGPLGFAAAAEQAERSGAFSALLWADGPLWFELGYLFAMVAGVALLLGWRTRTASVLFMIGVLSVHNRNPIIGDGGDNLTHLMAIYLVGTRCGQVWSLDARRRARGLPDADLGGVVLWSGTGAALATVSVLGLLSFGWALVFWTVWLVHGVWWAVRRYRPGAPRAACDMIANLLHNAALLLIIVQMCVLYAAAGWYKIQGIRWQDGTAVYFPMRIDEFRPWPALSDLIAGSSMIVLVLTYATVIIQVAFPFTLLNRRVKNVLLVLLIAEHAGIAVLLGLPFFSMAVIAADLVFLPTNFLQWVGRRAARLFRTSTAAERTAGEPSPELAAASP